ATLGLPDGATSVGTIRFVVVTNVFQNVPEYNTQGSPVYGNNTATYTETSTLAAYADLEVTGLSVTPATGLQSGNTVTVNWNDVNIGNKAAGAFTDAVNIYRVNADQSLTLLTSAFPSGPTGLAIGATSARSATLRLPDGSASVGTIRFAVTT